MQSIHQNQATASGTSTTMKAITQSAYGSPQTVLRYQEAAIPTVGDGEVLVRAKAAGTHIGDWLVVNGLPYIIRGMGYGLRKPKHKVPGTEISGVVETVGAGVNGLEPGDEVFGWVSGGGFAEFVSVPQESLAPKPTNLTFEQAAVVPISAFAALEALRDKAEIQPGHRALIIGASGGVGSYAVQIAKALGAEVTGVASTRNLDMVRSLGADHVIDYTTTDFAENESAYNVIIDTAGNSPLSRIRRALTPTGTLVIVGGSGGRWLMGAGRSARAGLLSLFIGQNLMAFVSKPSHEKLMTLRAQIEAGDVTPVIDRTYELADTPAALSYVGERHTSGKTVITI